MASCSLRNRAGAGGKASSFSRLFVSKVVTYLSQKTEIEIYAIQRRMKAYGNPETTRLLKAVTVGLRFMSLVLEEQSEFGPENITFIHGMVESNVDISAMLEEIDPIRLEAAVAKLRYTVFLRLIWGDNEESLQKI
jgi:hypothetical protein